LILVIDSGVWISALKFRGTPLLAIEQALTHHDVAICAPIQDEIRATLHGKFGWTHENINEMFDLYFQSILFVQIKNNLHGICRDPKDDMILECASLANASMIISGDKDLLVLKQYNEIQILTPREFIKLIESSRQ
jgi:putative PIN family toxin of toxin-antitoxin system